MRFYGMKMDFLMVFTCSWALYIIDAATGVCRSVRFSFILVEESLRLIDLSCIL